MLSYAIETLPNTSRPLTSQFASQDWSTVDDAKKLGFKESLQWDRTYNLDDANSFEGENSAWQSSGEAVFIPKIPIIPSDMPFQFKRLQLPVKLNFAISLNKVEGRSLMT